MDPKEGEKKTKKGKIIFIHNHLNGIETIIATFNIFLWHEQEFDKIAPCSALQYLFKVKGHF